MPVNMRVSLHSLNMGAPFWSRLISVRRFSTSSLLNERTNERTLLFLFKVHPACVLRRSSTELPFIHLCCVCSSLVSFQRVARAGERLTMTLFSSAPSKLNRELQRPKFPSHFTAASTAMIFESKYGHSKIAVRSFVAIPPCLRSSFMV